eukprot:4509510-Prymnesium_polylepis.1
MWPASCVRAHSLCVSFAVCPKQTVVRASHGPGTLRARPPASGHARARPKLHCVRAVPARGAARHPNLSR